MCILVCVCVDNEKFWPFLHISIPCAMHVAGLCVCNMIDAWLASSRSRACDVTARPQLTIHLWRNESLVFRVVARLHGIWRGAARMLYRPTLQIFIVGGTWFRLIRSTCACVSCNFRRAHFVRFDWIGVVVISSAVERWIWKPAWLGVLAMASEAKPKVKQLKRLGSVRAIAIKRVSC